MNDFNLWRVLSAVGAVVILVCFYVFYESVRSESNHLETLLKDTRYEKEFLIQLKEMADTQEKLKAHSFFTATYKMKVIPQDLFQNCIFVNERESIDLLNQKDWPLARIELDVVNISWMKDILHDDVLSTKWKGSIADLAFPEFRDLRGCSTDKWAKVRLLEGLRRKDTQDAFREVRHLAELTYSYGYTKIARNILIAETEFATAHPVLVPTNWDVIPLGVLRRTQRYFGGMEYLADPRLPDEVLTYWSTLKVGRCGTLIRGLELYTLLRTKHSTKYAPKIEAFNRLIQESGRDCLSSKDIEAWLHPKADALNDDSHCSSFPFKDPIADFGLKWKFLSWLPFVQSAILKCELHQKISEVY